MKKIIYIFAIMLFALVSCNKEESIQRTSTETTELDFFSVEYNYSDTIRLSVNELGYVDLVIASNNEDDLNTFLSKYEYYLSVKNSTGANNENKQELNQNENLRLIEEKQYSLDELSKISIEIIDVFGIDIKDFDIKCRQKTTLKASNVQKINVFPNPWYYEYKSRVHETYGKMKYTNRASNGNYIHTRVRYGYKKCLLCKVITWESGVYHEPLINNWGYSYHDNTFGYNGYEYISGTNIYRLYTGVLSYSPENFEVRFSKDPIPNW